MSNQVCVKQEKQEKLLDDSDQIRASSYSLLAALLVAPPSEELLSQLQGIETDKNDSKDIVNAWSTLQLAAQRHSRELIADEYHLLFIGLGRGELVPFASWYLTGFLMEKPLAHL
ncbi:MAG: molecular chaperone TorD family protein, partial [Gammaproteobacteria bacterium]|nr:molecular chaperone TorD family protein [Gammaproteobacteria bacterium]